MLSTAVVMLFPLKIQNSPQQLGGFAVGTQALKHTIWEQQLPKLCNKLHILDSEGLYFYILGLLPIQEDKVSSYL